MQHPNPAAAPNEPSPSTQVSPNPKSLSCQVHANHLTQTPIPIFTYGTLMAPSFLAWLLTGTALNAPTIQQRQIPAVLTGYKRVYVHGGDYPALIPSHNAADTVKGFLVYLQSEDELRKMDNFEGEVYRRVMVEIVREDGERVEAWAYVWDGGVEKLREEEWDFGWFDRERLEDWLDLFEGMEMV
ncbi:hypothetical protein BJ508DRAFT_213237 [Ascobolus immersus RN42]|uniref:Putative gamma-glutamylcyclotransferase n=1 Tax=Ascobolus immersus RN42 TaxID=1160509 RepID=A0A3N4HV93_ASCIM|nr:hypothetical protein BJ508DRAFT_213237 [Ascobolus immersus RN42]